MKRAIFYFCIFLLAVSCMRNRNLVQSLKDIETYVHDAPDSAMAVLSSLDTSGISSNLVDARFTLQNSIARYRLYIDEDDDTALVRAADYFRKHHDKERLMKTLFLAGYIQYNHADYKQSILTLTEGESLADELGDIFYGGLICRQLALVFERTFNYSEQLECIQKAFHLFSEGRFDTHSRYALLQVGMAYTANRMFAESDSVYSRVLEIGKQIRDTILCSKAMLSYAEDLLLRDDQQPQEALDLFNHVKDSLMFDMPCYSFIDAAYAAALLNNKELSEELFNKARLLAETEYDRYLTDYRRYVSAIALGDPKTALDAAQLFITYLQKNQIALERAAAFNTQRDFYYEKVKLEQLKHTLTRTRLLIIGLLLCLSIGASILIIRQLIKNRQRIQREKEILASRLQDMEYSYSHALKISLRSGMKFFNKLAELKWQNQSYRILPQFDLMLHNLAKDEDTFREMKVTLNETRNNLMVRLSNQVPTLRKDDLLIYCYLANHLDHTTICTILNRTPGALNSKIYRIREKIEKANAIDEKEFLDVISN